MFTWDKSSKNSIRKTINELYKVKRVSTNNKRHKIRVIAKINLYNYNYVIPYWKNSSLK